MGFLNIYIKNNQQLLQPTTCFAQQVKLLLFRQSAYLSAREYSKRLVNKNCLQYMYNIINSYSL
jgi:CMP-N-acetylneuraminic acid synthetase